MPTIRKVIFEHYRYVDEKHLPDHLELDTRYRYKRNLKPFVPSAKGGSTVCKIVLDDDTELSSCAECSTKDNFSYKTGRQIAYGRVMKKYEQYKYWYVNN